MPLDPGHWPEMPPDRLFWSAQLRSAAHAWADEGRRLRSVVRSPALGGPCAHALWSCADQLAADLDLVARQLGVAAGVVAATSDTAVPGGRR